MSDDACPRCGALLRGALHACPAVEFSGTAEAARSQTVGLNANTDAMTRSFAPGDRFGTRYTIVERIGSGGMGEIYKAIDGELSRTIALKLIRPDMLAKVGALTRFKRELQLAQAVSHPNVYRVHDLGQENDLCYIVMEYVDGQSLAALVHSVGHLSPRQTIALGRQICAGLQAIHEKSIVHRDLKPTNIMVDRAGQARVVDFGLAYQHGAEHLTDAGQVLGTMAYLSPEQARGDAVDARSDVYAIGLILYEMLTGKRPPGDGRPVPMALRGPAEPWQRPSHVVLEVPRAFDAIVARCLERDPAKRFATAADLERALGRLSDDLSSSVPLFGRTTRRVRMSGRDWRPWLAAPLVALGLVGGALWLRGRGRSTDVPTTPTSIAILPLENLGGDPADEHLGVGIADVLVTRLASLPSVTVVSREATTAYRTGDRRAQRVARDLGVNFVVSGGVQRADRRIGATLQLLDPSDAVVWAKPFQGTLADIFTLQGRMAEELLGALRVTPTRADRDLLTKPPTTSIEAFDAYTRGRTRLEHPDVAGNLDNAVADFEAAVAKDRRFALAHAALGQACWQQYQETKDTAWVARATAATTEALRLEPEQTPARFALALIHRGTGRFDTAIEELQKILAKHPGNDEAHWLRGLTLYDQGDVEAAVAALERAISLRPGFWRNHNSLGVVYFQTGKYTEAREAFRKVTELQPDSARGFVNLGAVQMTLDELDPALASFERGNALSPDAFTYGNIGTLHYWRKEYAKAGAAYEQALKMVPNEPRFHRAVGDIMQKLGRGAQARAAYERAVKLDQAQLAVNAHDAWVLSDLALNQAKLGRGPEALANIDQAAALKSVDGEIFFRKATIHAILGQGDRAVAALRDAVSRGFSTRLVARTEELAVLSQREDVRRLLSGSPAPGSTASPPGSPTSAPGR